MAKQKNPTSSITTEYDLLELPTAQHKAGLAGLVLQIQSMRERQLPAAQVPELEFSATHARLTFTEQSIQGLFDDLYAAQVVEARSASRWPGATIKREEVAEEPKSENGKAKKNRFFIYDVVQPRGSFLQQHLGKEREIWHKLWRDMLWTIPRGKPTTRTPFNARAAGEPCGEGMDAWQELLAWEKARAKGELRTCEVASSILLGAQAVNAEGIPFRDRVDHALLLHFWQLTVLTYVPLAFDQDGASEFEGYVLAIPEVADLKAFARRYVRMLNSLVPSPWGYRPKEAVIALPAQGALEFMDHLAQIAQQTVDATDLSFAISGVEFLHLVKAGNNVKTKITGRVAAGRQLLSQYHGIKQDFRNPLFVSALVLALLREEPWYQEFSEAFANRPWPFFIHCEQTPPSMAWLALEVARKFQTLIRESDQQTLEASTMSQTEIASTPDKAARPLEVIVYRLVRNYVNRRVEEKTGISYESFKDKFVTDDKGQQRLEVPQPYREAKERICSDLFLAFRSRRESDFVDYFTATLGSVGQFLPEPDYRVLAEALLRSEGPESREAVKTLAMLALSAASY